MEKEAEAAAASSEIAAAKEKAQRAGAGRSMLATELERKVKDLKQVVREHQLRRMKMLVRCSRFDIETHTGVRAKWAAKLLAVPEFKCSGDRSVVANMLSSLFEHDSLAIIHGQTAR